MDESISKSQKKRDAEALRKLGLELIGLSPEKLEAFPLTNELRQAILQARTITSHGAKRRQAQFIGKLMRQADHEAILALWEQFQAEGKAQTVSFHEAEQWRDRLIHEGQETLTEFIDRFQPQAIQELRQLIKKAKEDLAKGTNTGKARALFRYLRDLIP